MGKMYVALLRGVNVGGSNIIRMADLKRCFEQSGFENVATYIQSGNVLFGAADADVKAITSRIETLLSNRFRCASKVVVVSSAQLRYAVDHAPEEFGRHPSKFRYDVIFVRPPLRPADVIDQVPANEAVDRVFAGRSVLYFSRLIARASQSRLSRIASLPIYKELTIRNWNTTTRLLELIERRPLGM